MVGLIVNNARKYVRADMYTALLSVGSVAAGIKEAARHGKLFGNV